MFSTHTLHRPATHTLTHTRTRCTVDNAIVPMAGSGRGMLLLDTGSVFERSNDQRVAQHAEPTHASTHRITPPRIQSCFTRRAPNVELPPRIVAARSDSPLLPPADGICDERYRALASSVCRILKRDHLRRSRRLMQTRNPRLLEGVRHRASCVHTELWRVSIKKKSQRLIRRVHSLVFHVFTLVLLVLGCSS